MRVREIPVGVTTIYKKIRTIKSSSAPPMQTLELILSPSEISSIEKKQKAQKRKRSKRNVEKEEEEVLESSLRVRVGLCVA